jgi:hypothetical protein
LDICEEDVIIACGFYLLLEEEEKLEKRKYWIHYVFRAREQEGEFHTLFGRPKDDKFFKYFRIGISKDEYLKQLLHIDIEKKNTR